MYFVAVPEEGSVLRAAGRLRVAQPALSKQIRDLEREVGVMLFHRLPRGIRLRPAGEAFLVEARGTLTAAGRAVTSARSAAKDGASDLEFALRDRGLVPLRSRERPKETPSANVQIAAGETWALASEAIAAPYRTTPTAIVYRPFVEPPIPCWIALVWRPNERDPAGD